MYNVILFNKKKMLKACLRITFILLLLRPFLQNLFTRLEMCVLKMFEALSAQVVAVLIVKR